MEIFKEIKGYEGLYQISNLGNIKSTVRTKDRILKKAFDKCGYQIVSLCLNKKKSTKTVHRLVALNFLGESKLQVNHKDCNKSNNKIENLEYVTALENIRHAIKNNRVNYNFDKIAIQTRKKVLQINPITNEIINTFVSAHEASRQTGFNRGNISSTCRGNGILVGGYNWKYEN
jgi:hypothetical protein